MSLLICGKTPIILWVSSYSAANYFNCKANAVIAFVIQFLVPININFLPNYLISTPFHSPPYGWEKSLARYCGACVNTVHAISVCRVLFKRFDAWLDDCLMEFSALISVTWSVPRKYLDIYSIAQLFLTNWSQADYPSNIKYGDVWR